MESVINREHTQQISDFLIGDFKDVNSKIVLPVPPTCQICYEEKIHWTLFTSKLLLLNVRVLTLTVKIV